MRPPPAAPRPTGEYLRRKRDAKTDSRVSDALPLPLSDAAEVSASPDVLTNVAWPVQSIGNAYNLAAPNYQMSSYLVSLLSFSRSGSNAFTIEGSVPSGISFWAIQVYQGAGGSFGQPVGAFAGRALSAAARGQRQRYRLVVVSSSAPAPKGEDFVVTSPTDACVVMLRIFQPPVTLRRGCLPPLACLHPLSTRAYLWRARGGVELPSIHAATVSTVGSIREGRAIRESVSWRALLRQLVWSAPRASGNGGPPSAAGGEFNGQRLNAADGWQLSVGSREDTLPAINLYGAYVTSFASLRSDDGVKALLFAPSYSAEALQFACVIVADALSPYRCYQAAQQAPGIPLLVAVCGEGDEPPPEVAALASEAGTHLAVLRWSVGAFAPTWPSVLLQQYSYDGYDPDSASPAVPPCGPTLWDNVSDNVEAWAYKPRIAYAADWEGLLVAASGWLAARG